MRIVLYFLFPLLCHSSFCLKSYILFMADITKHAGTVNVNVSLMVNYSLCSVLYGFIYSYMFVFHSFHFCFSYLRFRRIYLLFSICSLYTSFLFKNIFSIQIFFFSLYSVCVFLLWFLFFVFCLAFTGGVCAICKQKKN